MSKKSLRKKEQQYSNDLNLNEDICENGSHEIRIVVHNNLFNVLKVNGNYLKMYSVGSFVNKGCKAFIPENPLTIFVHPNKQEYYNNIDYGSESVMVKTYDQLESGFIVYNNQKIYKVD